MYACLLNGQLDQVELMHLKIVNQLDYSSYLSLTTYRHTPLLGLITTYSTRLLHELTEHTPSPPRSSTIYDRDFENLDDGELGG